MNAFHHPRANREAHLCETVVAYEFKRGQRRSIGFAVGPEGLVVRAPKWLALREVDAALQEKSHWIIKKLGETRALHQRQMANRIEWCGGARFLFLGTLTTVVLDAKHGLGGAGAELKIQVTEQSDKTDEASRLSLHLGLPECATSVQIGEAVQTWLRRQARRIFIERLDHFAPLLQVQWRQLSLSNASTRWGSASSSGSIRLNWRLMHFKQNVIDYVVVHELSHLRVMSHSPRFWDLVRSVLPDYPLLRKQLKDEAAPHWA